MNSLKIGMYEQDITPEGKVDIPGQFYRRVTDEIESRIKVNIFACEKDGEQLIIASADLTWVSSELYKSVCNLAKEKDSTIDSNKIILSATHIHTAFTYAQDGFDALISKYFPSDFVYKAADEVSDCLSPEENFDFLTKKISEGIVKAWQSRKNAYIGEEFGRAVVGHSRRVEYDDGSAKMYGIADKATFAQMESGNDSGVELLYVFDENKTPIGVLANVSCPAQVLEHKTFISADYWGKVRDFTKEKFGNGFVVVGLCGAAGCQSPRDMIRFVLPDTKDPNLVRENPQKQRRTDPDMYDVDGAVEIGHRLADVINRKAESAAKNMHNDVVLKHSSENVSLPIRTVTETDYKNAQENIRKHIERMQKKEYNGYDKAAIHIDAGIIERYKMQDTQKFVKVNLHIARLGNIAFATNPFELFLDYGNKIRARSYAAQTFLIQLACGDPGDYLPTEKAEQGSHYSAYVASGSVGHKGGEILVDYTYEKIRELFE